MGRITDEINFQDDLLSAIKKSMEINGKSQKQVADEMDISPAYLSDILGGRRDISEEVANRMGFTRHVVFFPKRNRGA